MGDGWIGVDLDGTLAHYDHWRGLDHIGLPVPAMLARVLRWREEGRDVRIFTARASHPDEGTQAVRVIREWCLLYIGETLKVTYHKDFEMDELWDDRCVSVEKNTGRALAPSPRGLEIPS